MTEPAYPNLRGFEPVASTSGDWIPPRFERIPMQHLAMIQLYRCEECAAVVTDTLRHGLWHDCLNGRDDD